MVVAQHVALLSGRGRPLEVRDDEERGGQSDQRADQHAAPQRAVEHLLAHQQRQPQQQGVRPVREPPSGPQDPQNTPPQGPVYPDWGSVYPQWGPVYPCVFRCYPAAPSVNWC